MAKLNQSAHGKLVPIRANPLASELGRQALVHFLRSDAGPHSDFALERITTDEWHNILQQAKDYQLEGLLYRRLRRQNENRHIPADVLGELKRRYLLSMSRAARVYHIFGKTLRALGETSAQAIVLKGAFLAEVVYGDTALRLMTDLDLLVPIEDVPRVSLVLLGLGFRADEQSNLEHGDKTLHHRYLISDSRVFIEVHWNIDESPSPFKIDVDGLWARAQDATIAGVKVKALCPEDLLLHLCLHASFRHLFAQHGLRSMCDIAETIAHYEGRLDWEQVRQRSRQWGMDTCLFLALYFAERLVGAQVPPSLLKELKPRDLDSRFLAACERRLFANGDLDGPVSENWGRVQTSRSVRQRFAALLETAFPSRARLAELYSLPSGSWRAFLYYPARLRHLLQEHGPIAWRFWRADRDTRAWIEGEGSRVELETMKRMMLRGAQARKG